MVLGAEAQVDPIVLWSIVSGLVLGIAGNITLIVVALINRGKVIAVDEKVDSLHKEVKSGDGQSTGFILDDCNKKVTDLAQNIEKSFRRIERQIDLNERKIQENFEEATIEQAALATMFAAHISDGHDPIEQLSRRKNRRLGDPGEYKG
jgi:hypothetical protein